MGLTTKIITERIRLLKSGVNRSATIAPMAHIRPIHTSTKFEGVHFINSMRRRKRILWPI